MHRCRRPRGCQPSAMPLSGRPSGPSLRPSRRGVLAGTSLRPGRTPAATLAVTAAVGPELAQVSRQAIEDAERSSEPTRAALDRSARQLGGGLAATARDTTGETDGPLAVLRILEEQGFEPRTEENAIVLGTCPFHTLAQQHTDLVCAR